MTECPREQDVLEAVAFGRWPAASRSDTALHAHVAACAICADLLEVARALHGDRESACREAPVPSAGLVWWRATMRARADAARTAAQPITVWQGVTGACAAGLAGGLAAMAWRTLHGLVSMDLVAGSSFALSYGLTILLALGACLVLAPLALYVALADE